MFEFFAFLLGMKAGEKIYSFGGVFFRFVAVMFSVVAWWTFYDTLTSLMLYGIGYILLGIAVILAFIISFCCCIYRIETKHKHYSGVFPILWYIIMVAVEAFAFYTMDGQLEGLFYVLAVCDLIGIYLPKKILERAESRKEKSALINNVEYIIKKYIAKK